MEHADYPRAEHCFRVVVDYCHRRQSRSGTSGIVDLFLAKTILRSNQTDKFDEAYQIVKDYPTSKLLFNNYIFYYLELGDQLCNALGKKSEAKEFAQRAIELSKITEPQFSRHKNVGVVTASESQLGLLREIAEG